MNASDDLPKFICTICYKKVNLFHEFYNKVQTIQHDFLQKRALTTNPIECDEVYENTVSNANVGEYAEILISEVVKMEPCVYEPPHWLDSSHLSSPTALSTSSNQCETSTERPDVLDQGAIESAILAYFEPSCDLCPMELGSFNRAIEHYLADHKITNGYMKCCGKKFKSQKSVEDHARWHVNDANGTTKCDSNQRNASLTRKVRKMPKIRVKKETPKNATKTKGKLSTVKRKREASRTDDSDDVINDQSTTQIQKRKLCRICPSKLHRKTRQSCDICMKYICGEHTVRLIKCGNCIGQPDKYDETEKEWGDMARQRCVVCRKVDKRDRKVRQMCSYCKIPTCNEHGHITKKCHECAMATVQT